MRLTAFRISNGAKASHSLPSRIRLLAWGRNESVKGPVFVGAATAAQLPRNQKAFGFDRVALDFEHNTLPGTPAYLETKEPRAVAAYGIPEVVAPCVAPGAMQGSQGSAEEAGLFLKDLEWTPEGRANALNYFDLSPVVKQDAGGEVEFLHSGALCRQGAVEDLTFYSVGMKETEEVGMNKGMWAKLLGLSADVGEADLEKKVEEFLESLKGLVAAMGTLGPKLEALSARVTAMEASVQAFSVQAPAAGAATPDALSALSATVTKQGEKLVSMEAEIGKRDRQSILEQAAREGKVVALSAEAVARMPVEDLRALAVNLPVTVPLEQRTPGHVPEHNAAERLTETDKRVAAAMGYTAEQVAKANNLKV